MHSTKSEADNSHKQKRQYPVQKKSQRKQICSNPKKKREKRTQSTLETPIMISQIPHMLCSKI